MVTLLWIIYEDAIAITSFFGMTDCVVSIPNNGAIPFTIAKSNPKMLPRIACVSPYISVFVCIHPRKAPTVIVKILTARLIPFGVGLLI